MRVFISRNLAFRILFLAGTSCTSIWSQSIGSEPTSEPASEIFGTDQQLSVKLSYSYADLRNLSNDSTYISAELSYLKAPGAWSDLPAEIRVRGGWRRANCQYTPLKIKLSKEYTNETPFQSCRKAKLVLPCMKGKKANDNVIKELMAYKIYEVLSEYHFKTQLLRVELLETRKGKTSHEELPGFLIQDDEDFETAHDAKEIERFIDHVAQDEKGRVTNALFQYMIGNTDFSAVYLHNEKLFYVDEKIVPVPYDFDMSGLVNASYAVVSQVQNEVLPITEVTSRLYRGFEAEEAVLQEVRSEFLSKEQKVFEAMALMKPHFADSRSFDSSSEYIADFFEVLRDDDKFRKRIVEKSRKK